MASGDDIGPTILKANWTEASLAIVVVTLRIYTRAFVVKKVQLDDYCMILALVLALINTSLMTVSEHYGLGKHFMSLPETDQISAMKYDFYLQPFCVMSPAIGRISYALFILRIIPQHQKRRRWALLLLVAAQLVVNILCWVFIIAQCQPTAAFYDPKHVPGTCWSKLFQQYFGYFQGSWNSATDLILALFPATLFWNLHMKTAQKVILIVLMGLGVFAMVASCIKTWALYSVGSSDDYTYTTAQLSIWYTLEMYLVIIAASIPVLKPLFPHISAVSSSQKDSYALQPSRRAKRYSGKDNQLKAPSETMDGSYEIINEYNESTSNSNAAPGPKAIRKTTELSIRHHIHKQHVHPEQVSNVDV